MLSLRNRNTDFLFIAIGILVIVSIQAAIVEYSENHELTEANGWMTPMYVLLMPGFIVYVLSTGDLHGAHPGPIGQLGRVSVTIIFTWIFWTGITYLIYRKIKS